MADDPFWAQWKLEKPGMTDKECSRPKCTNCIPENHRFLCKECYEGFTEENLPVCRFGQLEDLY